MVASPSDECCALSRNGPNTWPPSTASARGRASASRWPTTLSILVSEVSCALPGCPPRETVVAFWTETERRHQFKLFKPAAEVVIDDLPPRWLKDALAAIEGLGCECC
jgi:nitrate reductase delta subunit